MSNFNKAPTLKTFIEPNRRFGHGYQARMVMSIGGESMESIIDHDPMSYCEIIAAIGSALEEINSQTGYSYTLQSVICEKGAQNEAIH